MVGLPATPAECRRAFLLRPWVCFRHSGRRGLQWSGQSCCQRQYSDKAFHPRSERATRPVRPSGRQFI